MKPNEQRIVEAHEKFIQAQNEILKVCMRAEMKAIEELIEAINQSRLV